MTCKAIHCGSGRRAAGFNLSAGSKRVDFRFGPAAACGLGAMPRSAILHSTAGSRHKPANIEVSEDEMHFVWMCVIGLLAGALAKLIMPGKDPGGIIVTMLLGIAGSLVAGFLGRTLGLYEAGQGAGLIMSILGAIVLLAIYRLFKGSTASA
jgi:uncharacterized membrane protein YeaQ/YmgE (transglycosylase-associated protein family)